MKSNCTNIPSFSSGIDNIYLFVEIQEVSEKICFVINEINSHLEEERYASSCY